MNRIPVLGILCFVILYYYSSTLYLGGSQANPNSIGYDWINNYWCNLMNENGMNGAVNPARGFSITAMIMLCGSLSVFFYQFADVLTQSDIWKTILKWSGLLSMLFAVFLFSKYHDLMTIVSSLFGLIVVICIMKEIYLSQLSIYKFTGVICLLLLGLNNVIYYSNYFIEWLPLIQKVTFVIVLLWILGLNNEIRKKIKTSYNNLQNV